MKQGDKTPKIRWYIIWGLAAFLMFFSLAARGHTLAEIESWETEWAELYSEPSPLAPTLQYELDRARYWFEHRHPCHYHGCEDAPDSPVSTSAPPTITGQGMGADAEQWRGVVASIWPDPLVNTAVCLIRYESGDNPNARNPSSGAAGLFQIHPIWASTFGGDWYDPATNTAVAYQIYLLQGLSAWSVHNRGLC